MHGGTMIGAEGALSGEREEENDKVFGITPRSLRKVSNLEKLFVSGLPDIKAD